MKTKRFFKTVMSMLVAAICCTSFSSCDEDRMEALQLNGTWFGDFGMNYSYGRWTFDSYETTIRFHQSGISNHGTGTQVDYYREGPYERLYYDFDWWISNGVVKLRYHWAEEYDVNIYDYRLTSSHFYGRFENGAPFNLESTDYWYTIHNSYYDRYHYGCDIYNSWGYDYPWRYYAKEKKGTENAHKTNDSKVVELAPGINGVPAEGTEYAYPAPSEIHLGNRNSVK